MKKLISLIGTLALFLALAGCGNLALPTTLPSTRGTTIPVQTTLPPETTLPLTEPPVTEPPTEEERVAAAALAFLELHMRNLWLCEENDWTAFTILAAPEAFVTDTDRHNIGFLTETERYWREVRKDSPRNHWETNASFPSIVIENGIAAVSVNFGASFYYEGLDVPSGFVAEYDLILRNVDGQWLVSDARLRNDWFDETYHDVPGFTADELIAGLNYNNG